ncbi:MAG: DUF2798 domain-containing protein [Shinella sp.]|uniref:DUF2798 domain-containing protein n=1 Tax=Shinella sp. TaxID=1870904 RepID=UPI0040368CC3
MNDPRAIIVAQFFISGMMAFLMTGFFSILHLGMTGHAVSQWSSAFVIAWPVAFVLSLGVGKMGFAIAYRITARLSKRGVRPA